MVENPTVRSPEVLNLVSIIQRSGYEEVVAFVEHYFATLARAKSAEAQIERFDFMIADYRAALARAQLLHRK